MLLATYLFGTFQQVPGLCFGNVRETYDPNASPEPLAILAAEGYTFAPTLAPNVWVAITPVGERKYTVLLYSEVDRLIFCHMAKATGDVAVTPEQAEILLKRNEKRVSPFTPVDPVAVDDKTNGSLVWFEDCKEQLMAEPPVLTSLDVKQGVYLICAVDGWDKILTPHERQVLKPLANLICEPKLI